MRLFGVTCFADFLRGSLFRRSIVAMRHLENAFLTKRGMGRKQQAFEPHGGVAPMSYRARNRATISTITPPNTAARKTVDEQTANADADGAENLMPDQRAEQADNNRADNPAFASDNQAREPACNPAKDDCDDWNGNGSSFWTLSSSPGLSRPSRLSIIWVLHCLLMKNHFPLSIDTFP